VLPSQSGFLWNIGVSFQFSERSNKCQSSKIFKYPEQIIDVTPEFNFFFYLKKKPQTNTARKLVFENYNYIRYALMKCDFKTIFKPD